MSPGSSPGGRTKPDEPVDHPPADDVAGADPDEAGVLARWSTELHAGLDAGQVQQLRAYLDLLARWAATYNLTAIRGRRQMLTHHLADCLAVVAPVRRAIPGPARLLDVGSGAGLPAVVLAIAKGSWQVVALDAVAKKAAFVRQAAGRLDLPNLTAAHGRLPGWRPAGGALFDVITARAFSTLRDLVVQTAPLLAPGGVWAAMKGVADDEELAAAGTVAEVFHVERLEVPELAAERHLVWMRPLRPPAGP